MIEKFDENMKPLHYMFIGFHCIRFFVNDLFSKNGSKPTDIKCGYFIDYCR